MFKSAILKIAVLVRRSFNSDKSAVSVYSN